MWWTTNDGSLANLMCLILFFLSEHYSDVFINRYSVMITHVGMSLENKPLQEQKDNSCKD